MHFLNIRSNLEVHDVRTQWGLHIWAKWRLQRWTKSTVLTTPHWSFSTLFDPSTEGGSLGILSQTFDSLQTIGGLKMWFRMTSDICMEQGSKIRLLCLSVCLSVCPSGPDATSLLDQKPVAAQQSNAGVLATDWKHCMNQTTLVIWCTHLMSCLPGQLARR